MKLPFLDRMLVTCEVYGVPVTIVMNKVDLYREEAPEFTQNFIDIYTKAGYKVVQTSAKTGRALMNSVRVVVTRFVFFRRVRCRKVFIDKGFGPFAGP